MRRFIDDQLQQWQVSTRRKPLILRGARQVGKTWSLKEFGKNRFESVALVDLERNPSLRKLFDGDLNAARICSGQGIQSTYAGSGSDALSVRHA